MVKLHIAGLSLFHGSPAQESHAEIFELIVISSESVHDVIAPLIQRFQNDAVSIFAFGFFPVRVALPESNLLELIREIAPLRGGAWLIRRERLLGGVGR